MNLLNSQLPRTYSLILLNTSLLSITTLAVLAGTKVEPSSPNSVIPASVYLLLVSIFILLLLANLIFVLKRNDSENRAQSQDANDKISKTPEVEKLEIFYAVLLAIGNQLKLQAADTRAYSAALSRAGNTLQMEIDPKTIEKVVEVLRHNTAEIKAATVQFEKKLKTSEDKVQELSDKLAKAEADSLTDPLTSIANRRHFDKKIAEFISECKNSNEKLSLAILDIDHFKSINDRFGHTVGDQVLQVYAKLICKNLRKSDFVSRFGGEEFAVLMPGTDLYSAKGAQSKLLERLRNKSWLLENTGDRIEAITASIGISELCENDTSNSLISRADEALYIAKNSGRNMVVIEN